MDYHFFEKIGENVLKFSDLSNKIVSKFNCRKLVGVIFWASYIVPSLFKLGRGLKINFGNGNEAEIY